jgi:sugar phosphate isomerase/epimerase
MELADGTHLTYCTNVHPGENWQEHFSELKKHLPEIRRKNTVDGPMGVGLRLSAKNAAALSTPAVFDEFASFLEDGGYYVFTLNGFPYGVFHRQPVKAEVYRPDWADPARLAYTDLLADLLARMLPDGVDGSISTVPLSFKAWGAADDAAIQRNLLAHVAHLVAVREQSGKTISLAIEPEPCCILETIAEAVTYFERFVFSKEAEQILSGLTGQSLSQAQQSLRRHMGLCYDVCHAAVEFEDPRGSIAALRSAGIAIGKVQLSSALKIPRVHGDIRSILNPLADRVYLHQVVQNRSGTLLRFQDMPDALEQLDDALGAEWRIHFHIPIFRDDLEQFGTTQDFLGKILDLHREEPITRHLEVETYTWDVLPAELRNISLAESISREIAWVVDRLSV